MNVSINFLANEESEGKATFSESEVHILINGHIPLPITSMSPGGPVVLAPNAVAAQVVARAGIQAEATLYFVTPMAIDVNSPLAGRTKARQIILIDDDGDIDTPGLRHTPARPTLLFSAPTPLVYANGYLYSVTVWSTATSAWADGVVRFAITLPEVTVNGIPCRAVGFIKFE